MVAELSNGPDVADVGQWRDKKRHLWLMGLIAPTAIFVMLPLVWALNQCRLACGGAGAALDRPILLYVCCRCWTWGSDPTARIRPTR